MSHIRTGSVFNHVLMVLSTSPCHDKLTCGKCVCCACKHGMWQELGLTSCCIHQMVTTRQGLFPVLFFFFNTSLVINPDWFKVAVFTFLLALRPVSWPVQQKLEFSIQFHFFYPTRWTSMLSVVLFPFHIFFSSSQVSMLTSPGGTASIIFFFFFSYHQTLPPFCIGQG